MKSLMAFFCKLQALPAPLVALIVLIAGVPDASGANLCSAYEGDEAFVRVRKTTGDNYVFDFCEDRTEKACARLGAREAYSRTQLATHMKRLHARVQTIGGYADVLAIVGGGAMVVGVATKAPMVGAVGAGGVVGALIVHLSNGTGPEIHLLSTMLSETKVCQTAGSGRQIGSDELRNLVLKVLEDSEAAAPDAMARDEDGRLKIIIGDSLSASAATKSGKHAAH